MYIYYLVKSKRKICPKLKKNIIQKDLFEFGFVDSTLYKRLWCPVDWIVCYFSYTFHC